MVYRPPTVMLICFIDVPLNKNAPSFRLSQTVSGKKLLMRCNLLEDN